MENEIQQNTPLVQPLLQTSTSIPTLPSTNWSQVLLFTILGLIVVAGSVFAGIQIGKTQTPIQQPITAQPTVLPTQAITSPTVIPTQIVTPTVSLTATPTIDPTANWKSFTSVNYGFAVKYPQDWLGKCKDIAGDWETWESASICELRAPNTNPYTTKEFVTISVQKPLPERNTLAEIVTFELKNFGKNLSPKSINGVDGYFYTNKDSSVFFTQKGNYFIVINWFPLSEENKYKITLDQILSTFKFTN